MRQQQQERGGSDDVRGVHGKLSLLYVTLWSRLCENSDVVFESRISVSIAEIRNQHHSQHPSGEPQQRKQFSIDSAQTRFHTLSYHTCRSPCMRRLTARVPLRR